MTPNQFCYWLQGWMELSDPKNITEEQFKEVKEHLDLVFYHETDSFVTESDYKEMDTWFNTIKKAEKFSQQQEFDNVMLGLKEMPGVSC